MWVMLGLLWCSLICGTVAVDLVFMGIRARRRGHRNALPELGGAALLALLALLGFVTLLDLAVAP
jgi:hypothetical protein